MPSAAAEADAPLVDVDDGSAWEAVEAEGESPAAEEPQQSVTQQLQQMSIVQRVRAAMKGSREMRVILIRDPNKLVASAVLSSPKLTLGEIEAFAKMADGHRGRAAGDRRRTAPGSRTTASPTV